MVIAGISAFSLSGSGTGLSLNIEVMERRLILPLMFVGHSLTSEIRTRSIDSYAFSRYSSILPVLRCADIRPFNRVTYRRLRPASWQDSIGPGSTMLSVLFPPVALVLAHPISQMQPTYMESMLRHPSKV